MADVLFVLLPFQHKALLEPEEKLYLEATNAVTHHHLDTDERRSLDKFVDRVKALSATDTMSDYVIPAVPQWATRLSAVLRAKSVSHDCLDLNFPARSGEDIESAIRSAQAKVYLLSSVTNNADAASTVASLIKKHHGHEAIVVYGGPHATALHRQVLITRQEFDYVVRGEGELTLAELVPRLLSDEDPTSVQGLTMRLGGGVKANPDRPPIDDLGNLPLPNLAILPSVYKNNFHARIFTVRGCPMRCSFCGDTQWSRSRPRFFPLDRVLEELDELLRVTGARHLFVNDETFLINRSYAVEFMRALARYGIRWSFQTRPGRLDGALMRLARTSGCRWVFFGAESGSDAVLGLNQKGTKVRQVYEACRTAAGAGLLVTLYWLVGLPGETRDTAEDTITVAEELFQLGLTHRVEYYIAVPYPGTPIYADPAKYGVTLRNAPFRDYGADLPSVMSTETLSGGEIYSLWRGGLKRLAVAMQRTLQ